MMTFIRADAFINCTNRRIGTLQKLEKMGAVKQQNAGNVVGLIRFIGACG